MICLDTNAVIAAINRRKPELRRRLEFAIGRRHAKLAVRGRKGL